MTEPPDRPGVLRAREVRRVAAPVLVECTTTEHGSTNTMTVIPLMDGERIEAFEVRCHCGSSVIVECVYEQEER